MFHVEHTTRQYFTRLTVPCGTQRPQRLELNWESMFHVEHSRELEPAEKSQTFLET